ncbi:MAG: hypothetical protein GY869_16495, partial [Planctomycetes bacterium]|nr:hypothetical protein [Planctomycetota bacterium]
NAPGKDIYVEVLNSEGQDIDGYLYVEGGSYQIGGGLGGLAIIDEVPSNIIGGIGPDPMDALATNSQGQTYGITQDSVLVEIDTTNGVLQRVVGDIIDTDSPELGGETTFTGFEAATFDPETDIFYAAVTGPSGFDGSGNPISETTILITINPVTGEAAPAGSDSDGVLSYTDSVIGRSDVRTIVFDQTNTTDIVTFIGFDIAFDEVAEATTTEFISIALEENGDGFSVVTETLAAADDDDVVEGLMFDNEDQLYALHHPSDAEDEGILMLVDLANTGNLFQEIVAYIENNDTVESIILTGMSFDTLGGRGFATDPVSNTLYSINVEAVEYDGNTVDITGNVHDVYMMYVASSTPDVYITVTRFDTSGNQIVYTPTDGEGAILFDTVTPPEGTGGGVIGTTLVDDEWHATTFDNAEERSSTYLPANGVWSGGYLRPGIQMPGEDLMNPLNPTGSPQQNSIGKIQVGGGVYGDVNIEGSIGTFYAGFLGTNRFNVSGDMGSLLVGTQAGGTFDNDIWHPAAGGANVNVSGQLGSFYSNGEWAMPLRVRGYDDVPQYQGLYNPLTAGDNPLYVMTQSEYEYKGATNVVDFMDGGLDEIITNDSFETAQFVGTFRSENIEVAGTVGGAGDTEDYYSFGVMAGQTLKIKLYDTGGEVGSSGHPLFPGSESPVIFVGAVSLYGPDQSLVAVLSELDAATGAILPLEYTSESAGIYTAMVSSAGSYRLEISGITETTMGGGNVLLDMYNGTFDPAVQVMSGNLGAINIQGRMSEGGGAPSEIRVEDGDLVALRGSFTSIDAQDPDSVPVHVAATGSIGMIHAVGNSAINITAREDVQYVLADADYTGQIIAWGNVGVIEVTGNFTTVFESGQVFESSLYANAEGEGSPGIIDMLYVGGSLDGVAPISTGGSGGNLRFAEISAGTINALTFEEGETITIVDDSGAQLKIAPGLAPPDPDQVEGDPEPLDGTITLDLLEIYDVTIYDDLAGHFPVGHVITRIESTDGLHLTSDGGPVEVGVVIVEGILTSNLAFTGDHPISILRTEISGTINQVINNSGHREYLSPKTGRWEWGRGHDERWIGGDLIGVIIAAGSGVEPEVDPDVEVDPDAIPEQAFDVVKVSGNLGLTQSTTGQLIQTIEFGDAGDVDDTPIAAQRSGLYSETGINKLAVLGALGDVNITEDVLHIIVDHDDADRPGEYDGINGVVIVGGSVGRVDLGDGITAPGTGEWPEAGLFVVGTLEKVFVDGPGHDIEGPIFSQTEIQLISISDGARLVGFDPFAGISVGVMGSFSNYAIRGGTLAGPLLKLEVKGEGSELFGAPIFALGIDSITVDGGAEGIFYSTLWAGETAGVSDPDIGYFNELKVGGQGIHDSVLYARRHLAEIVVLPGGTIEDTTILVGHYTDKIIADEMNSVEINVSNWLGTVSVRDTMHDVTINAAEIDKLTVKNGITASTIHASGPVNQIQTKGDLLGSVEINGPYGDLKKLKVGGDFGTSTGSSLLVDGQVGSIAVGGDFLGEFLLNMESPSNLDEGEEPLAKFYHEGIELKSLKVGGRIEGQGGIGGDVGTIKIGEEFGNLGESFVIDGNLKKLMVGSSSSPSDLESSVTVRNDLNKAVIYGSVNGAINVHGDLKSLQLKGTADHRADLNASVLVGGKFNKMMIIEGNVAELSILDDEPIVIDAAPKKFVERGSDFSGTWINHDVGASADIDGSLTSSGRWLSTVDVGTLRIGGDIEAGGLIEITGDLDHLIVDGDIKGMVHVTGSIGVIETTNIMGVGSIITAGGDIGKIMVIDSVTNSYVLAGFDPGTVLLNDGTLMSVFDQLTVGSARSGDIKNVEMTLLDNSVIAAGVSPGSNGVYGDMDGSDTPGSGLSSIYTIKIGQIDGDGDPFGVFADNEIKTLKVAGRRTLTPVIHANGFRAWSVDTPQAGSIGGFVFQQGLPFKGTLNGSRITVTMSGPGSGELLPGLNQIDTIQLTGTTSSTKVKVMSAGGAMIDVGALSNGDDESLGQLIIDGRLSNATNDATLEIGGDLDVLSLGGTGLGSELTINGSVNKLNVDLMTGAVGLESTLNIGGGLKQLNAGSMTGYTNISAQQIAKVVVRTDMNGFISSSDGDMERVTIKGDMGGKISSEGDINQIVIKGAMSVAISSSLVGGIRAGDDIGSFLADSMNKGVVAAGGELGQVKIKHDMRFSTLSAGLDIGADGTLFDGNDTAGEGDIKHVLIGGDFIESNITAALAPGADGMFGTNDDQVKETAVDEILPPQVKTVQFIGTDLSTIIVKFADTPLSEFGHINTVMIKGEIEGSDYGLPTQQFAIAAAGTVQNVTANRQVFEGVDNVLRLEVDHRGLEASSIESDDITSVNAATAAIRVIGDGLDHEFGTADDVVISGDDDPLTAPTVYVSYDQASNEVRFYNENGLLSNLWGTNYYKIFIDADQVTNTQGVPMASDFELVFAMGDLGDMTATAFEPFIEQSDFPANDSWHLKSFIGDNMQRNTDDAWFDQDFIRMSNLSEGELLEVTVDPAIDGDFTVLLWQVSDNTVEESLFEVIEILGVDDINDDPDIETPVDMIVPELDELAYAGNTFYFYEDLGQTFYKVGLTAYEPLVNTLDDLNSLVASDGIILELNALTGHSYDTLWAIAGFNPNDPGADPRQSLVLFSNISRDINGVNPAEVQLSELAAGDANSEIIGLGTIGGVLYGVDATTSSLFVFDSDPTSATFGLVTDTIPLVSSNPESLTIDDLYIAGLDVDLEGDDLLLLHDLPEDVHNSFMPDALYRIDPGTGDVSLMEEYAEDYERHGLATEPGGFILAGMPLRESPLGDTIEITFEHLGTMDHVFGSSTSEFSVSDRVTTDVLAVPENARASAFVDAGFHYVFDIAYSQGILYGDTTITFSDIDWLDDRDILGTVSLAVDEPDYADIELMPIFDMLGEFEGYEIEVTIDAANGDGNIQLYFGQSSYVDMLLPVELMLGGSLQGDNNRNDLSPARDLILPDLEEITTNVNIVHTAFTLDMSESLEDDLAEVLPVDLMEDLLEDLSDEVITEVLDELILLEEDDLYDDFLSSQLLIEYDGIGYDAEQELISLISTSSYKVAPIEVEDPADDEETVFLTRQVLSDIFDQNEPDFETIIQDIRGFEFGGNGEVYAIVTVSMETSPTTSVIQDSLLIIDDIMTPTAAGMSLAILPMSVEIDSIIHDLNITSLAFDHGFGTGQASSKLYGLDADTQTLVNIDAREMTSDGYGNLVQNLQFGKASLPSGKIGNLGESNGSLYDVQQLDFDVNSRLYGLEMSTSSLVQIGIESFLGADSDRLELVMALPESAEYCDLNFNISSLGSFLPGAQYTNAISFYVVRKVSGDPLDSEMQIRVDGSDWANHTFGSDQSVFGDITVSSAMINGVSGLSYNSAEEVAAAGGYYRFDVSYPTGFGLDDVLIDITDIVWSGGSQGDVDVVFIDGLNAT